MEPIVLSLVLISAICHAAWNALTKNSNDPWSRMAIGLTTSSSISFFILFLVPAPSPESWPFILASACTHQIYFTLVCLGYRLGDLSQVYSIQRGIAPILVTIGALFFAQETLNPQGSLGILIISLSIISLTLTKNWKLDNSYAIYCALVTGLMIATYTIFDGLGARLSGNVFGYISWLYVLDTIPFAFVVFYIRRNTIKETLIREMRGGIIVGILGACAYATSIWALTYAPMAYVSALRETSVIIAAWLGCKLLKEPFGIKRIIAAIFILVGVLILQTS